MKSKINFGEVLQSLRKSRGISQSSLANELFISRPTYANWEKDVGDIPLSKLYSIADFYGITMIDLISLFDKQNSREYQCNFEGLLTSVDYTIQKQLLKSVLENLESVINSL